MPIEADALERLVADKTETSGGGLVFHEGMLGNRRVAWCVGGIGRARAARAARLLVDGHRPMSIISAGFAGGLDSSLDRGSIVRPAAVRGPDGPTAMPLAGGGQAGPLLITVDHIVRTASEKRSLAATTGAAIVDMETVAVADVAREVGLACYGLRLVSDAADDELPPDLGRVLERQSIARKTGAVLGMLAQRPRAAFDLWRLWERAVVDGRALANAVVDLVGSVA